MTATTTPLPAGLTHAPLVRTLAVLTATIVLTNAQIYNIIPLFPGLAREWQVPTAQLTWLSTAIAAGYTVGFVLLGPLTDRLDRRRMLVAGAAATSLTTLAVAASDGLEVAVVLRALQGFTAAIFAPAAFVYIASRIAPRHRSLALSTVVSGALAASVAGQVGGQLLNAGFGWRSVYVAGAALLALAAVALRLTLIPDPATGQPGRLRHTYLALPRLLVRRDLAPLYAITLTALGGFVAVYT
ncbi:MAG: MFS transporter, partial [Stackebrandtia sp.]